MVAVLVGDMHVTPQEVHELDGLMDLIYEAVRKNQANNVIFLGDQHHTHSVVHSEVIEFWDYHIRQFFNRGVVPTFIIGNHDQSLKDHDLHPFLAYVNGNNALIVESYQTLGSASGYPFGFSVNLVAYRKEEQDFLKLCKDSKIINPSETLICHQTFKDALFENGQIAPEGFDSALVPQKHIISGHIHKAQKLGKVWYPGTPRWRTLSDANETEKYVYVVDFLTDRYNIVEAIPTSSVVKRIISVEETEQNLSNVQFKPKDDIRVLLKGNLAWINSRKPYWLSLGAKVRTVVTGRPHKVKESLGIDKAFQGFVSLFKAPNGSEPTVLASKAQQRLQDG
jgi:DNA repair exonuclease SbcCD nuclease subunit